MAHTHTYICHIYICHIYICHIYICHIYIYILYLSIMIYTINILCDIGQPLWYVWWADLPLDWTAWEIQEALGLCQNGVANEEPHLVLSTVLFHMATRPNVRQVISNHSPLGIFGFALWFLVLSCSNSDWLKPNLAQDTTQTASKSQQSFGRLLTASLQV